MHIVESNSKFVLSCFLSLTYLFAFETFSSLYLKLCITVGNKHIGTGCSTHPCSWQCAQTCLCHWILDHRLWYSLFFQIFHKHEFFFLYPNPSFIVVGADTKFVYAGNRISTQTGIGTCIAIAGVALYSYIKAQMEEEKRVSSYLTISFFAN